MGTERDEETPAKQLRARLWGTTGADVEYALHRATYGPSRAGWNLADVERLESSACPFDVEDPSAIAGERGERWAYVVHRLRADVAQ